MARRSSGTKILGFPLSYWLIGGAIYFLVLKPKSAGAIPATTEPTFSPFPTSTPLTEETFPPAAPIPGTFSRWR